jgi:hypothetical protein
VDGADQVGQPGLADRPRRRRPAGPGVISRPRHPQGVAGPPGLHALSLQLRDQAVAVFWAHHRLHRGCGFPQDLHFLFQVADPGPGRRELGALLRRGARLQAPVHQIAMPPAVQTRLGNPQRRCHITDSTARLHQIEGMATELRWIWSWHRLILSDSRAPAVSRHASPLNRVKINVSTLRGETQGVLAAGLMRYRAAVSGVRFGYAK